MLYRGEEQEEDEEETPLGQTLCKDSRSLEYLPIAGRIGAQGGHRPQVPEPPVGGGQLEDAVGEGGQEFVLPGAALLG